MRVAVRSLRITSLVLLIAGSALPTSPVRGDDFQDILGVWVPVALESDGTALTADQLKAVAPQLTFTITKEKMTSPLNGANEIEYTLGPDADPKTIDTVDLNGPQKGQLRKGIYELRDDSLKLCIAAKDAPRPQRFSTKAGEDGTGDMVITFQRKKP
jgi:uncharacterized protein (TIGR03067 family)